MNPETLEKLNSDAPEFTELRHYIYGKIQELESIHGIQDLPDAEQQALEVKARIRAFGKLVEIFTGLIPVDKRMKTGGTNKDYVIE